MHLRRQLDDFLNPGDREPYDFNFFVQIDANPNETVWGYNILSNRKDIQLEDPGRARWRRHYDTD